MRLDVVPENPLESLAKVTGFVPTPMVLGFWGMGVCRCLIAGARLGIFEILAENQAVSSEQVALQSDCNPAGIEALLNALSGFGYLNCEKGTYSLSKISHKWLVKDSKYSIHDSIIMLADLWDRFGSLEDAVKTGRTPDFHDPSQPPDFWKRYVRGLAAMAKFSSSMIVRKIKLPKKPARLLDIGGGHGLFSIEFCKKYSLLNADVLDLPQAAEQGRQIVKETGFEKRIQFIEGDFNSSDWGADYDLVLLFNVIHIATPDQVLQMFKNAYRVLKENGVLVVLDAEHQGCTRNVSQAGGFAELFFYVVNGTKAYPENSIRKWMVGAGFSFLYRSSIRFLQEMLIVGQKQS